MNTGGHRGTFLVDDRHIVEQSAVGLLTLLSQIKEVIPSNIPLIAAGGIADGYTAHTAMELGASAVCIGTLFLTSNQSTVIPQCYKDLLLAPYRLKQKQLNKNQQTITSNEIQQAYRNTCLTRVFSGKPARGIYNKFIAEFEPISNDILPWNDQSTIAQPVQKYAGSQGNPEYIQAWAGQNYSKCRPIDSKQIVLDIIHEIKRIRSNSKL